MAEYWVKITVDDDPLVDPYEDMRFKRVIMSFPNTQQGDKVTFDLENPMRLYLFVGEKTDGIQELYRCLREACDTQTRVFNTIREKGSFSWEKAGG